MEINKENIKETIDNSTENIQKEYGWQKNNGNGKIFSGLILIGIGLLFLAREMGAFIPYWIFSWPVLLIVIGLYIGVKHQFQKASGIILILVGAAFLVKDLIPEINISNYLWPIVLIILGLYTILKPKRNFGNYKQKCYS